MQPIEQIRNANDFHKLFNFMDSNTPAAVLWAQKYCAKHHIPFHPGPYTNLNTQLANIFLASPTDFLSAKQFAKQMANAWRVRKCRQKKDAVSLSITLDESVASQLSEMCEGMNKSDVISKLIQGNFQAFITEKHRQKESEAQQNRLRRALKEQEKLSKIKIQAASPTLQTSKNLEELENLRLKIAQLYDLIFSGNLNSRKLDDNFLLQATKIYYSAFSD